MEDSGSSMGAVLQCSNKTDRPGMNFYVLQVQCQCSLMKLETDLVLYVMSSERCRGLVLPSNKMGTTAIEHHFNLQFMSTVCMLHVSLLSL